MESFAEIEILKVAGDSFTSIFDPVAHEMRLHILVNGKEVLSLYCTPTLIKELVVGFLTTEEVIAGGPRLTEDDIKVRYGKEIFADVVLENAVVQMHGKVVTSGCIGGVTRAKYSGKKVESDNVVLNRDKLREIFTVFQGQSESYKKTGCIHSAALADTEGIVFFAEDIGRHNAVDKAIGGALLNGHEVKNKIMLASGRLSSEICSKCAQWEIPVIVSRTAPTLLSVSIAKDRGITLVGFLRGRRFNVYSHPERIL